MKNTKLASFRLNPETIRRLSDYSKKKSINKSALIDRLINEEIDKNENRKKIKFAQSVN
jgi:predicted DNA-binding protein